MNRSIAIVLMLAGTTAANGQSLQPTPQPDEVVRKCIETVSKMPGLGAQSTSNDSFRAQMQESCMENGGQVPGETIGGAPLTTTKSGDSGRNGGDSK